MAMRQFQAPAAQEQRFGSRVGEDQPPVAVDQHRSDRHSFEQAGGKLALDVVPGEADIDLHGTPQMTGKQFVQVCLLGCVRVAARKHHHGPPAILLEDHAAQLGAIPLRQ